MCTSWAATRRAAAAVSSSTAGISPRAIEMGFREECEKNALEIREQLTALKTKHLFETTFETFKCDDILEGQVQEIEEWARARNRVSECRQQVRC